MSSAGSSLQRTTILEMALDPAAMPDCSGITESSLADEATNARRARRFLPPPLQNPVVGRTFRGSGITKLGRRPAKTLTEAVFGFPQSVSKLGKSLFREPQLVEKIGSVERPGYLEQNKSASGIARKS